MAYNTTILGPVILHEPVPVRDKTSAQVRSLSSVDSRLNINATYWIEYSRIREIVRDATVQLARQAVVSPMIHTPWNYVTKKDAPEDAVDFLRDVLEPRRDWLIQNAIYGALDFGWAPFEIIYAPKEGKVVIQEFKQLLQDYTYIVVYIETGKFAGFTNEPILVGDVAKAVVIEVPYALNINLCVEGTDWYGISTSYVLDPICDSWDDVDKAANRYDKKVAGATWVVYYPVGETMYNGSMASNDSIARRILSTLEASGAVAIPDEIQEWLDDSVEKELKGKWRVELISAPTSTQSSFIDRLKYLDNLKMRAFGIPERSILEGKFGTKAEADVHADVALSTVDTKHRLFCDQLNELVLKPLLRLNYGEKYQESVWIQPAPLVDAQFQTVKDIYRLIMMNPDTIKKELENIDVPSLREQIGVPSSPDAPNEYDFDEEMELQKQLANNKQNNFQQGNGEEDKGSKEREKKNNKEGEKEEEED